VVLAATRDGGSQEIWPLGLEDNAINKNMQVLREEIVATWGVSLLYSQRAQALLQEIRNRYPVPQTLLYLLNIRV